MKVADSPPSGHAGAPPVVRARICPLCQTASGEPCQPKPAGDHLARYMDAYTAAQLTREYMALVLGELVVIDSCTVITISPPDDEGSDLEAAQGPCCWRAAYDNAIGWWCPEHGDRS